RGGRVAGGGGAGGRGSPRARGGGGGGGRRALAAARLIMAGVHRRVLTVAFEKQSDSDAMWALTVRTPFQLPVVAGAGGYFAPIVRGYIERSGAPADVGIQVAVKDRLNALRNPHPHR